MDSEPSGVSAFEFDVALTHEHFAKTPGVISSPWRRAILICFVFSTMAGVLWWNAQSPFMILLLVGVAAAVLVQLIRLKVSAKQMLAKLGNPAIIRYRLTEQGLRTDSKLGGGEWRWEAIETIRKRGRIWFLRTQPNLFIIFPMDQVPCDALAFLENQVASHGGRIIGK